MQAFHIHEFATEGNDCSSTGGHYNPYDGEHGPLDAPDRHVGALGNIPVGGEYEITDGMVTLDGEHSAIGKSIVIHEGEDDFGPPMGNAGPRVACGTIELVETTESAATQLGYFALALAATLAYAF